MRWGREFEGSLEEGCYRMTGETKRRKEGVEEGWQEETGRREKEGGGEEEGGGG